MNYHTLVKVYGNITPASDHLHAALESLAQEGLPTQDDPVLERDGDMLRVQFAGLYFPFEEFLEALRPHLTESSTGKLDYIDLDAWMLHRHLLQGRSIHSSSVSLNHVLDYSGH